jgi:uracil-DNA glycosylase family 4
MNSLEELADQVKTCKDCSLCQTRTFTVPGEGPDCAELMFIGEGPGYNEDQLGRPFVGSAGKFLESLLTLIGLNRQEVFITNVVKCRPPANRDPLPAEVDACNKYLFRQIELVNPKLIITLGRFSLAQFFPGDSISRVRGRVREKYGRHIYPVMHPAAALHRKEYRAAIIEDFKAIPLVLQDMTKATQSVAVLCEPVTNNPEHLSIL